MSFLGPAGAAESEDAAFFRASYQSVTRLTEFTNMLNACLPFDYDQAFSRNIGWVTRAEQADLRGKRIAIAGNNFSV